MNFKVGQRVRVIAHAGFTPLDSIVIGKEGVIAAIEGRFYRVHVPDAIPTYRWGFLASELAPLTDPGADAFMERIKKLKPYEEPVRVTPRERMAEGVKKIFGY